jgi:hypothetical protein
MISHHTSAIVVTLAALAIGATSLSAQSRPTLYIEPTTDQFEVYLAAAMSKKKVPVLLIITPTDATYRLNTAGIDEEVVGTGRRVVNCLFASCSGNDDKASTSAQLVDASGVIVWSYAVNKGRGAKNRQSMAEAIAEHLKNDYLKKQGIR